MKTMLYSDFLSIRRSLPQSLLVALVVAVICTLFGGVGFAGAIVCAMMPIIIVFSMQLYDDQNDWSGYRLTLPVNRRQVVWGRYLFMALCAVCAFVVGCVIVAICGLLSQAEFFSQTLPGLSGAAVGGYASYLEMLTVGFIGAYCALLFVLVLLAITLPLLMRYGLTQAIRLVPLVCCIIFILVMVWLSDTGNGLVIWLNTMLANSLGALWLGIGAAALCCALYLVSAALATKLYTTREF